jgi:hypothetical protein
MTTQTEERTERADRWLRVTTDRMLGIEPDWWLRMACGQVAEVSEARAELGVIAGIEEDSQGRKQS